MLSYSRRGVGMHPHVEMQAVIYVGAYTQQPGSTHLSTRRDWMGVQEFQ